MKAWNEDWLILTAIYLFGGSCLGSLLSYYCAGNPFEWADLLYITPFCTWVFFALRRVREAGKAAAARDMQQKL